MIDYVLLTHLVVTLALVGLIWFVQIVHYPLFAHVGSDKFVLYEKRHQRLTTDIVAPLMFAELGTALLLFRWRPDGVGVAPVTLGLALIAVIWLITLLVQVPQHAALESGYDPAVQRALVAGNWWRTAAWTARGVLALWIVAQAVNVSAGVKVGMG